MSGYQRLVAYIYAYKQGEKCESVGFVKINARGKECKIRIRLRGDCACGQKPCKAYIFRRSRERLLGQPVGELEKRDGGLEWNGITDTDSLMGGGFGLQDSQGLYIEGEERVFAADWKDSAVEVERFVPLGRFARQENEELAAKREEEQQMEEAVSPALEDDSRKGEQQGEEENFGSGEVRSAAIEKEEQELRGAQIPEEVQEIAGESPGPEDRRWRQWQYLERHFPVMRYAEGGGAVASAVRLSPREISRIPRDKWELGNNSFLLHGLYQYKHILLLRRQSEDRVYYQIGVPGVYNEQEQMMASMFGFQEFKVMKGPDVRAGSFGYWCRTLAG